MKSETFDDFCRACVDLLRSSRVPYIVVGGVAVTVVGEPRFTADLIVRSLFVEELALEHSRARRLFKRMVRIPSPEDLMILKVLAGRTRDLLDAEGILRRNSAKFDRRYVEKVLLQVADLAEDHAGLEAWRRVVKAVEKP